MVLDDFCLLPTSEKLGQLLRDNHNITQHYWVCNWQIFTTRRYGFKVESSTAEGTAQQVDQIRSAARMPAIPLTYPCIAALKMKV